MRLFGRRYSAIDVSVGNDQVMFGYPIPSGGVLNNIWVNAHLIGPEGVLFQSAVMYGISAFVIQVPDPETAINFGTLWDNFVPKDVAESSGAFDLDTDAADVTAEFEMGELDIDAIFDMTPNAPLQIFRRRKMLTVAQGAVNYEVINAGADLWTPGDVLNTQIKRNVRVNAPSAVVMACSSPAMDVTTTTQEVTPSENEWAWLQYLEMGLEQAFIHLMGLVESGAETPWEEAGAFVASLLERAAVEETAGSFAPVVWRVFTAATIELTVPGSMSQKVLSSEG